MNGAPAADAATAAAITAVVTRRVKPGHEAAYEAALARLQADGAAFDGYLGATTQQPAPGAGAPVYTSVIRFAGLAQWQAFERSARRAAFAAEVAPHVQADAVWDTHSGLEFWFSPPAGTVVAQPVRWRMALVMVVVVFALVALVALIGGAVAALLPGLPAALRLLLTIALEVALLTWWLMPRLTRWLAPWIYPRTRAA